MREVARAKIEAAIRESNCEAVTKVPREAVDAMIDSLDHIISVGMGPATKLMPTYRHRHESIKEFREGNFGWRGFFNALGETKELVGLLSVQGGGWRMIILLNESSDSVLASLLNFNA